MIIKSRIQEIIIRVCIMTVSWMVCIGVVSFFDNSFNFESYEYVAFVIIAIVVNTTLAMSKKVQ